MTQKIRLMIGYRHLLLRQALRTALTALGDVDIIHEARDGKDAIEKAAELDPDVILMDTQMPIVSGVEATAHIRRESSRSRVLLMTLGADDEIILSILRAGAAGCILKDADLGELAKAIRTVARGGTYLSPEISDRMVQNYVRFSERPREADVRPRRDLLSVREREVLQKVAEGMGNQAIARQLTLSVKTVEAHKAHIAQKLGVRGRTELIKYAIRKGLIELESVAPMREAIAA
ncbi:MAG: response regulator transcription factor [Chloroflexota bacterium]|nr:MAG: response regulator transcription factor [Chloroflexota bacterium]